MFRYNFIVNKFSILALAGIIETTHSEFITERNKDDNMHVS